MSWKYCGWLLKKWAPSACRQTQTTSRPSGQTQTGNESYICSNITRIYKCTHTHTHIPKRTSPEATERAPTELNTAGQTHSKCLAKHFLFSRIKVFPCGWNMITLGNLVSVTQMPRAL